MTRGLQARIEQGLVNPENGEGFHGIAFDFDGDGRADASIWAGVGPDGEVPLLAVGRHSTRVQVDDREPPPAV